MRVLLSRMPGCIVCWSVVITGDDVCHCCWCVCVECYVYELLMMAAIICPRILSVYKCDSVEFILNVCNVCVNSVVLCRSMCCPEE